MKVRHDQAIRTKTGLKIRYHAAKMLAGWFPNSWGVLFDFTNDGCTAAPDKIGGCHQFVDCCAEHDFYYGNDVGVSRTEADWNFYQCLRARCPQVSALYYIAVRVFGGFLWDDGDEGGRDGDRMEFFKEDEVFLPDDNQEV